MLERMDAVELGRDLAVGVFMRSGAARRSRSR